MAESPLSRPQIEVHEAASDARTADDRIRWDDDEFERAPRNLLRRVLSDVRRDPEQRGPLTERLFPMLLRGTPARQRLVYESLRIFAEPQDILGNALLLYLRCGDAEPLVIGSGLLEDLGAVSWPVLAAFARTGRPECAYFVPAIVALRDVDSNEGLEVLNILAHSRDPELRWRVYEASDEFSRDEAIPIWRSLVESGTDDAARDAARERLEPDSEESAEIDQ